MAENTDVASITPDDTSAALDSAGSDDIAMLSPTPMGPGGAFTPSATTPTDYRNDPNLIRLQQEEQQLRGGRIENARRMVGMLDQDRQNRPPPPQLQPVPKAPEQKLGQGANEWLMVATLLGALAGSRARSGTTGALNAFAAAVKGFHDGQLEVFKEKSQEWKQQSDAVISDNQTKLQQYRAILEDKKMNLDQMMEEYKIVASTYGDEISGNLADQRNYTLLGQLYQKDVKATVDLEAKTAQLNRTRLQIDQMIDDEKQRRDAKQDATLDFYADQYNKTGKMPSVGYGKNASQLRQQIAQRAQERAAAAGKSGEDIAQGQIGYKAEQAGATTAARRSQQLATNVENATNEVQQLIPQAMQTSRALPRGKFVPWNTIRQAYLAGKSDPAYNDFMLANFSLINAYTRAMNPQGVPRVNDRLEQHANGILSAATSQQAYEVQVRRLWLEVLASREATRRTLKGVGTEPNEPFPGDTPPPAGGDQGWGNLKVQ